jgi:hypothetical protein
VTLQAGDMGSITLDGGIYYIALEEQSVVIRRRDP